MSKTTNLNLGDHFTIFLRELIDSGRYSSESEAICSALRLLELEEAKINNLHNALIQGEISGESTRSFRSIKNGVKLDINAE